MCETSERPRARNFDVNVTRSRGAEPKRVRAAIALAAPEGAGAVLLDLMRRRS